MWLRDGPDAHVYFYPCSVAVGELCPLSSLTLQNFQKCILRCNQCTAHHEWTLSRITTEEQFWRVALVLKAGLYDPSGVSPNFLVCVCFDMGLAGPFLGDVCLEHVAF